MIGNHHGNFTINVNCTTDVSFSSKTSSYVLNFVFAIAAHIILSIEDRKTSALFSFERLKLSLFSVHSYFEGSSFVYRFLIKCPTFYSIEEIEKHVASHHSQSDIKTQMILIQETFLFHENIPDHFLVLIS